VGISNAAVSSFSAWFSAGSAAGLSLIVINVDKITAMVGVSPVKHAIVGLLVSLVLGALAKLFSSFLAGICTLKLPDDYEARVAASKSFDQETARVEFERSFGIFGKLLTRRSKQAGAGRDLVLGFCLVTVLMGLQVGSCVGAIGGIAKGLMP
jgi:hypothetical protein